jgi:hypothetical protein
MGLTLVSPFIGNWCTRREVSSVLAWASRCPLAAATHSLVIRGSVLMANLCCASDALVEGLIGPRWSPCDASTTADEYSAFGGQSSAARVNAGRATALGFTPTRVNPP